MALPVRMVAAQQGTGRSRQERALGGPLKQHAKLVAGDLAQV